MDLNKIKTQLIEWNSAEQSELKGEKESSFSREVNLDTFRIRLAEYSANYKSARWCDKGHIIHCITGEIKLIFKSGKEIKLCSGNSIVIGEGDSHIGITGASPAKLFVID